MLRFLLDTDMAIFVIRTRPIQVLERFRQHEGHIAMSAITLAELVNGAERSADPARNLRWVEDFRSRLEVIAYGEKAAVHYGSIRAALERAGNIIGVNDLHIAAQARSEGLTLVTNNLREFTRVPGLLVENWKPQQDRTHP